MMKYTAQMKYDHHTETVEGVIPSRWVWVVYKQWPTGKIERHSAYFNEKNAREAAGKLVGQDEAVVGLETIAMHDEAECLHDWASAHSPRGGVDSTCRKCGEHRHLETV